MFLSLIVLAAYCKKMPVVEDTKLPHSGNVASADHSLSIWDPKTFQQFLWSRRRTLDSIGSYVYIDAHRSSTKYIPKTFGTTSQTRNAAIFLNLIGLELPLVEVAVHDSKHQLYFFSKLIQLIKQIMIL